MTIRSAVPLPPAQIPAPAARAMVDGAGERERQAAWASIAPLMYPAGIIVAGATRRSGSAGRLVLTNLLKHCYRGRIAVVDHHAAPGELIGGVRAYASAGDVPFRADLVVVSVPAEQVSAVIDSCGSAGVRGAVVLSAGFAEAGNPAGQADVAAVARRHGMTLIGPNCLGILNTDPAVQMNATFASLEPCEGERGGIAFAAQSGAVGIAMLNLAAERGASTSSFVSLGNMADISAEEMLLYWEDDPRTGVIALHLESLGDARRFRRIARRIGMVKPIVMLRSGRAPDVVATAQFRDAGVIFTDTTEELMDVAMVLGAQPVPTGRRIAILGNAGGPGGLAADSAHAAGAEVPSLTTTTQQLLRDAVPDASGVGNPIDLGADATPQDYEAALDILSVSGEIDSIIAVHVVMSTKQEHNVIRALGDVESRCRHWSPESTPPLTLAAVLIGGPPPRGTALPWFGHAEAAARAVARASGLGAWRAEQRSAPEA